jgi:hypothetical protein
MNAKDFAIGVLSVTAAILLTTVVLLSVLAPRPVQAFAQLDQGSGYTMYTWQVDESRENLTIINHQAGLLNIYRYDINTSRLAPLQQIPLTPAQAQPAGGATGGRGRGR